MTKMSVHTLSKLKLHFLYEHYVVIILASAWGDYYSMGFVEHYSAIAMSTHVNQLFWLFSRCGCYGKK